MNPNRNKNLHRTSRSFFTLILSFFALIQIMEAGDTPDPDQIIQRFAAKEDEFRKVWQQYTYVQMLQFQILGRRDRVQEQREMLIEVYFTKDGERKTRVLQDRGRLVSLQVTQQDIDDAIGMQPFVLTTDQLPAYQIRYKGKERVDELDTYVFEVKPKKKRKGKRYFKGKIYVDDLDFQIVMTEGKIVPDLGNNIFPKFLTIREQIDGDYWFPTWIESDDYLHGYHVRQLVTFSNFKKFEVGTTIEFGEVKPEEP